MNTLSWFIYLAQVVDDSRTLLIVAVILVAVTFVVRIITTLIRAESAWMNTTGINRADCKARAAVWEGFDWKIKPFSIAAISILAIFVAIPSRQTLILVAGSEIGQRAANSQAMHDIVNPGTDLLKAWIKRETEKLASESKK